MKIKNKYFAKIIVLVFFSLLASFGIATSSITPPQLDKNNQNQLKTYKPNNKNNNLKFLKDNVDNKETHIKGNQSALNANVIWASHKEDNKEKDSFYLQGLSWLIGYFKFDSEEKIDGYKKIDLSNQLKQKNQNEVIQNFSLGDANGYDSNYGISIAFWTKTTNDNKYHIYTAGFSRWQLGREDTEHDKYQTFKRIKNPTNNSENFDEIKELSLTLDTLTIWTKDSNNEDHIYFGGENYGQFGDGSRNYADNKLVEKTQDIKPSINNQKIKDIAFDYNNSGFILTENNKLFAAGKNTRGELGVEKADNITKFKEVDTSALGKNNIKQMSTSIHVYLGGSLHDEREVQSLILVTGNNKLWGLGYDGTYNKKKADNKSHSLGIDPGKGKRYLTKLTNIPLECLKERETKDEKILYAQTCMGYNYAQSILITKTTHNSHKIYTCGYGVDFSSTDPNYKWAYNEEITNKIFGNNGMDINFNIENLGNAKYKNPVSLWSGNITAMGKIKTNKEKQFQQQCFSLAHYDWWKTSPITIKEPTIDNASVKIKDNIDEVGKGKITYTFNINSNYNTIIYNGESKVEINSKVGQEKYELKDGDSNGKDIKVIISNIDLSEKKEITYNGIGHKFNLTIGYQFQGSATKYTKPIENEFKPFKINKDIKIDIEKDGNPKIKANKFIYNFKMKQIMGNYVWKSKGDAGTGLSAKIIPDSKLQGANIKLEKRAEGQNLYSLIVSDVSNKQATYNLDECISLEGDYKDSSHETIGKGTWKIKDHFKLGKLDFKPIPIPTPTINNVEIKDNVTDVQNHKGTIEYIFNINTQDDTIIKDQTELKKPNPIGQETYELKPGDVNGKGWSVIINNIDTTIPKDKPRIYNELGHNFTLSVAYTNNKYPGTPIKCVTFGQNTFKPFIINKAIDIKMSKVGNIKINKNSFSCKFTMDKKELNGYNFTSEGEAETGLTSKIKIGTHLKEAGAKSMLIKNSDGSFTLKVYDLPSKKDTYNIDGTSIFLEGNFKDSQHINVGKGVFHFNLPFKNIHFEPVLIAPPVIIVPPALSTLQIILIAVGIPMFFILSIVVPFWLLRKKETKNLI